MTNGFATKSTVLPSGAARIAASVPIISPAPGRLSITTVTFCVRATWSPSSRAMMSLTPPGALATMNLMVRAVCGRAS